MERGSDEAEAACEELYSRLTFLLNELEPWESKLVQARRRMKLKMRREKECYVEKPVKVG